MFTPYQPIKDTPLRLSLDQVEEANHVISSFFEGKSLGNLRDELRTWYEAAIVSEHPSCEMPQDRGNLFNLYYQLELLIEAAFVVNKNAEHLRKN